MWSKCLVCGTDLNSAGQCPNQHRSDHTYGGGESSFTFAPAPPWAEILEQLKRIADALEATPPETETEASDDE